MRPQLSFFVPGRSFAYLLAAVLAVLLLTGCIPVTETPSDPTVTQTPALKTPAPTRPATKTPTPTPILPTPTPTSAIFVKKDDLQNQQVTFWHPYRGLEQAKLEQMVTEFNRSNEWGIRVNPVSQEDWGTLDEKMRQVNSDPVQPDILVGYNTQALQWDLGGWLLVDQALYVSDPLWGLPPAEIKGFYPTIWAQDFVPDGMLDGKASPGGKRLGMPWYSTSTVLLYNLTRGAELGFAQPPRTSDELKKQACAAAQAFAKMEPGSAQGQDSDAAPGAGGWLVTDEASLLSSLIFAFGGEIARPDRAGYQFDTSEARQAVLYLSQLYTGGCVWRDAETNSLQAFGERKALIVAVSSAELGAAQSGLAELDFADEWTVLPFYSPQGQPVVDVYGPALLITQSDPERQLASWLFVRWMVSPQSQVEWALGSGDLPTSALVVQSLMTRADLSAPLRQVLEHLPYAHSEPVYASWSYVRPAQAEALDFILLPDRKNEDIIAVLKTMDLLAAEIQTQWSQP